MKKVLLLLGAILLLSPAPHAQDYTGAVGFRFNTNNAVGITLKKTISSPRVFELIVYPDWSDWNSLTAHALAEVQKPAFGAAHLFWYYGFGMHFGLWHYDVKGEPLLGIDGMLGIEYNFEELPVSLGIDWKPAFNIIRPEGVEVWWSDDFAISTRFTF